MLCLCKHFSCCFLYGCELAFIVGGGDEKWVGNGGKEWMNSRWTEKVTYTQHTSHMKSKKKKRKTSLFCTSLALAFEMNCTKFEVCIFYARAVHVFAVGIICTFSYLTVWRAMVERFKTNNFSALLLLHTNPHLPLWIHYNALFFHQFELKLLQHIRMHSLQLRCTLHSSSAAIY